MELQARQLFEWRGDPTVPEFDDTGPFVVMDAMCGLCAKCARWIARSDKAGEFRIIPMQSSLGRALFIHYGLDPDDPASWPYVVDGAAYTSFDGMIRAGRRMGGLSAALVAFRIVPRPIQDWLYVRVARNRYRFLGRADLCAMPDPDVQARLIR